MILNFLFGPKILNLIKGEKVAENSPASFLQFVTDQGRSYVDGLEDEFVDGKHQKTLWGWAFLTSDKNLSPADFTRSVVLISEETAYIFDVRNVARSGVETHFADLKMNLANSGFSVTFSEDMLMEGEYRIGILFKNPDLEDQLILTDKLIKKTLNSIELR